VGLVTVRPARAYPPYPIRYRGPLAESKGRVSGPSGAAAKLKIAPFTLAHRIKTLNINKSQFKFG
jgi:hypothetical protein